MEPQNPEDRIAELERQLAAGLRISFFVAGLGGCGEKPRSCSQGRGLADAR
jgi:hypothetical protein